MIDISMKRAGAIYVIFVMIVAGAYYFSLSSQDEFLRDNRWVSDNSALNLVLENEVTLLYTFQNSEMRQKLPTEYRIGNSTTSIPIDNEGAFLTALEDFKEAATGGVISNEEVEAYFEGVTSDYYYDEFQYTAAITTIDLELIREFLTILGPNIPPVISGTEDVFVRLHAVSIIKNNIWRVMFLVEEDVDGNYFVPEVSLERYFDYELEEQ